MQAIPLLLALALVGASSCAKMDEYPDRFSDVDRHFMTAASYRNNAKVALGELVAGRSASDAVRRSGTVLAATYSGVQAGLANLGVQMGKTDLPTAPDTAYSRTHALLQSHSGRAFDSACLKIQVAEHTHTIALMQAEIENGRDQRLLEYAGTQLRVEQKHKQAADSLFAAEGFAE